MQEPIRFTKIKLTNKIDKKKENVMLNSMHKYEPRLCILKLNTLPNGKTEDNLVKIIGKESEILS